MKSPKKTIATMWLLTVYTACGGAAGGAAPAYEDGAAGGDAQGRGLEVVDGQAINEPDGAPEQDAASDDGAQLDAEPQDAGEDAGGDDASADDVAAADIAPSKGAPYPIILAHGFFGTDKFADLNFATYFFEVKADLAKQGETEVFTPAVEPFNSSEKRAEELLEKIKQVLKKTGRAKVNLIGHSQGGLDARVIASKHPELVSAVITIAAPHKGTPVADIAMKLIPNDSAKAVVDALGKIIGVPLYGDRGKKGSVTTSVEQFTTSAMKAFAKKYPDRQGVARYSIAGRSGLAPHMGVCKAQEGHDFVVKLQSVLDPIDPMFALTESLIDGTLLSPKPNDGLVRVEDAKWGTFLGCVPADHIDQVGHLFGDKPGLVNPFSHKKMFRWLVKMLRLKGH